MRNGTLVLSPPFKEINDWIYKKYGVEPLYIAYRPLFSMLHIIFSNYDDLIKFNNGSKKFYKTIPNSRIEYWKILLKHGMNLNDYLHLNITHFAALSVKFIYSTSNLTGFQQQLNISSLWQINHVHSYKTAFFFLTEKDKMEFDTAAQKEFLRSELYNFLKKEDEYNSFEKDRIIILIDSKDNFVNNYQSSMQYYIRDH